jgi:alpha-tubulin suppressor-like RCC1 family protein
MGVTGGVQAISLGNWDNCAVVNGDLQCWGASSCGELGDGSTTDSAVPVQVMGLTSGVVAIAAGDGHTCAVVNGGVQCWGRNDSGQLGNGSYTNSPVPVPVSRWAP